MKTILFSLSILISTTVFSHNKKITEKIINFKTNKKSVSFSTTTSGLNTSFIIIADNGNTKDYTNCEWKSILSYSVMVIFIKELSVIDFKKEKLIEYSNFVFKAKRNKIHIQFINSKCIQEHKTHYFQESCNRLFSFVLTNDQKEELVTQMSVLLNDQKYVKK